MSYTAPVLNCASEKCKGGVFGNPDSYEKCSGCKQLFCQKCTFAEFTRPCIMHGLCKQCNDRYTKDKNANKKYKFRARPFYYKYYKPHKPCKGMMQCAGFEDDLTEMCEGTVPCNPKRNNGTCFMCEAVHCDICVYEWYEDVYAGVKRYICRECSWDYSDKWNDWEIMKELKERKVREQRDSIGFGDWEKKKKNEKEKPVPESDVRIISLEGLSINDNNNGDSTRGKGKESL